MGTSVHFAGIETTYQEIRAVLMNRKFDIVAERRDPMPPCEEHTERAAFQPLRWAREISQTLLDLVETSGVPVFKIWGYAPVTPPGWICLDIQGDPLSDLVLSRKAPGGPLAEEIMEFLNTKPNRCDRLGTVFTPKDYLRFHWNHIIATDYSDAANLGLLDRDQINWDPDRLTQYGIPMEVLPPVFPSTCACGRITPEGSETTGLQSSAWTAAGSTTVLARIAACGSLHEPCIYLLEDHAPYVFWIDAAGKPCSVIPALKESQAIACSSCDAIPADTVAPDAPVVVDWSTEDAPEELLAWARATGRPVFTSPFAGRISPGAAVLAALSSGVFPSLETFYKKYPAPRPLD